MEQNSGSNIKHWQKAPSSLCKWRKHYSMNGKLTIFLIGTCCFLLYLVFMEIQQKFQIRNDVLGLVLYTVNFIRAKSNLSIKTILQSWWKWQIVTTISVTFVHCFQLPSENQWKALFRPYKPGFPLCQSGFRYIPLVCKTQLAGKKELHSCVIRKWRGNQVSG